MGATGLRERKKQQTRQRMIDVALELFDERGFDRVPVAEVARAAEVSEATVFNYFPTKEDLVYQSMEAFEATLLDAVRLRPAGTSVVAAFRDCVLQPRGALAADDPAMTERIARTARIIAGSGQLAGLAFARNTAIWWAFLYQADSALASLAFAPAFASTSTGTASRM